MDPHTSIPAFLLVLVLIATNAYFVAAEFALIAVRRSRLEQEVRDGDRRSAGTLPLLDQAEQLALAAQVGSSAATVLVGLLLSGALADLAGGTVGAALSLPWRWVALASPALAVVVAVALVVGLHVVLGEQVPKIIGIQRAEMLVRLGALKPLQWLALLLRPLTALLGFAIGAVARLFRTPPVAFHPLVHTPDEIRNLVSESHQHGVVEEDEREMIHGVFQFTDTVAREVMTPRTDMVAVPADVPLDELIRVVVEEGHSRFPVFEGSIDSIVGVLLAKDLLPVLRDLDGHTPLAFDVRRLMREPYFVPDTKPVDDILAELQQQGLHMAIVLDEFGGTYGLLTMEDLLEEIVGEIHDEYDVAEPEFSISADGDVLIDGGTLISEVNERLELALPVENFDTIGGYIFGALGRVPVVGDVADALTARDGEVKLVVEGIEERRITRVRLTRASVLAEERTESVPKDLEANP